MYRVAQNVLTVFCVDIADGNVPSFGNAENVTCDLSRSKRMRITDCVVTDWYVL